MFNRYEEFPSHHATITPSDTAKLPNAKGMIIYCGTAGTIAVEDEAGTIVIYTVDANTILPVLAHKVRSTSTTVSQIIGLY